MWSVATKSLVSTCTGHTDYVRAVAATPSVAPPNLGAQDGDEREGDDAPLLRFPGAATMAKRGR